MSIQIPATSTATSAGPLAVQKRQARDNRGRITKVNSVIKASQVGRRYHAPCVYTQSMPTVPNSLFSSGSKGTGRIEMGAFTTCEGPIVFKMTITRSAGGTMPPAWGFFERLTFRGSGGSTHLCTLYPDTIGFMLNADYDKTQQEAGILDLCGAMIHYGPYTHANAGTTTYHLPICRSFLQDIFCDEDGAQDILVDFYPLSGGICHDGGASVACTIDSMSVIFDSRHVTSQDRASLIALNSHNIISAIWTEAERVTYNSKALQPSQSCRLDLDNINGSVVAFLVYVCTSGAVGAARYQYVSLGKETLVDVRTSSGVSRYGSGTPSTLDYQTSKVFPEHFQSDYAKRNAVVFIPQCDDVRAALHGVRSGGARQYSGDRDHIMLTPAPDFGGGTFDVIVYALVHKQIHKRSNHFAVENA